MASYPVDFEAHDHISPMLALWWVLVICSVIGGVAGHIVNRFKPPVYEARAVLMASIDFNKIDFFYSESTPPPPQFSEGDENLSLNIVGVSLTDVEPQVVTYAQQSGILIDAALLKGQSTIERKHAYWNVSFRHPDPAVAQDIVNYWAQQALADLQAKQKMNQLSPYIFFDLIQLADLPKSPKYFRTNWFVLTGGVIGLVIGIFLVSLPLNRSRKVQLPSL
jgi:uncharacterized protein involved in exopolysaccharide biosynthesis